MILFAKGTRRYTLCIKVALKIANLFPENTRLSRLTIDTRMRITTENVAKPLHNCTEEVRDRFFEKKNISFLL